MTPVYIINHYCVSEDDIEEVIKDYPDFFDKSLIIFENREGIFMSYDNAIKELENIKHSWLNSDLEFIPFIIDEKEMFQVLNGDVIEMYGIEIDNIIDK